MNRVFEHRGDLVAFVKEIRGYNTLTDAVDAMCDLLKQPSAPLATSSSPVQHALDALAFAHGAIGDAIGLDEGLDGVAGQKVLAMIDAALRANGRLPPDVPLEDDAVAPTPYWTASIEPDSSPAWEPKLRALIVEWQNRMMDAGVAHDRALKDGRLSDVWAHHAAAAAYRMCIHELAKLMPLPDPPKEQL